MQFNEKLKKLRAEKGVSQSELAEKIYVSRSAVAKWENGLGLPSRESLNLLAEFFNVDKNELLSDPETAHVIINKNHTLSKQKLWIMALVVLSCVLIVVAAVLIPLALKKPAPTPEPTYIRELIFETEKDTENLNVKNYADDVISTDKYFAPSRILTYDSNFLIVPIPNFLIKYTYGDDIYYTEVKNRDVSWPVSENCEVKYSTKGDYIYVLPADEPYGEKTEYCINFAVEDMRLSIKIKQEPIRIETIDIELDSTSMAEVKLGDKLRIYTHILPINTDNKLLTFKIDKIVRPNGIPYGGPLDKFAEFPSYMSSYGENFVYYIEPKIEIEPGSEIYFYAMAEHDNVYSNILKVRVARVQIDDIFLASDNSSSVVAGSTIIFTPVASPSNATFNIIGEQFEVTLATPEMATLVCLDGHYYLTATTDETKLFQKITVLISTPEKYSKLFYWTIENQPIEVSLYNADNGKMLEKSFFMEKGSSMRFAAATYPDYYTCVNTQFTYKSYYPESFFTVSDDGKTLTVAENAPGGMRIYLTVSARIETAYGNSIYYTFNYTITVPNVQLEGITLKPNSERLIKGEYLDFTYEYFPANADVDLAGMAISMLDKVTGVKVISGAVDRVFTYDTAVGGTKASFEAAYNTKNGLVKSNIVTLTVQNIPVTDVMFGIETFKVVLGETYPLALRFNTGADITSVQYKLLDTVGGVYFTNKDNLFVAPDAAVGTKFKIQADVDGVESNIINLEIVESPQPEQVFEISRGTFCPMKNTYYPAAKANSVKFILVEDVYDVYILNLPEEQFDRILSVQSYAATGTIFHVTAIIDGVADRVLTFKIVEPPEEQSITVTTIIQAEEFKRHGY